MEKDLISVIVPIYNVGKYLEKCLKSIINQTYKNMEIILVDDGSTDNSGSICDKYVNVDSRINVIHKKNGGASEAKNVAIDIATGQYITFVDSDDYIQEDYIEYLYNLIKKYNCNMCVTAYYVENANKKITNFGKTYEEKLLNQEEAISRMLCEEGFSVSPWAKLYKKEIFKGIRYPVGKIYEDNETTYKLMEKCEKIAYGNEPKYTYVKRENSVMNTKFSEKRLELITLTDNMAEELYDRMPNIRDAIIRRKIYARLSILRQIIFSENEEDKKIAKQLRKELLSKYKKQFFVNPKLDVRDKIAFISLCFGLTIYKLNWKIYLKMKG